jgi:replicative DNA helicase
MNRIDWDYYEYIIIYNALTNRDYLSCIIDQTAPEYFNNKDIRIVFKVIDSFFEKRHEIPTLTEVKTYLPDDVSKTAFKNIVNKFTDIGKKYNRDELYDNTEQFLKERAVYNTMMEIADKCASSQVDTGEVYEKFNKACSISLSIDRGHDYFEDIDTHIEDLLTIDNTIPTTWPWLDEKIGGGYLENGRAIYVLHLLTDDLRDKALEFKRKSDGRILIKEFPPNTVTCNQVRAFIERIINSGVHIDAIVLDYVNLLRSNRGANSYERVKYATEELRALSYIFNCPIITATQLNRQGYNEVSPELDTISESIGLAATADCIFGIWQEEEDAELGIIKLGIMKNRFGPNFGNTTLNIDYKTLTITDDFEQGMEVGTDDINAATSALSLLAD